VSSQPGKGFERIGKPEIGNRQAIETVEVRPKIPHEIPQSDMPYV
jgi:hypothetical protein